MPHVDGPVGRSVWFDLPVADLADAMSFYTGLLGWEYSQMEESVLPDYVMIQVEGKLIGGLRKVASPDRRAGEATILYFTVDKLAPKVARAKELGAEIVGQTISLGRDRGRYQWIRDRQGNLIGLWAPE
jgi:predicted enzyme related to lactoylglutathione lyase